MKNLMQLALVVSAGFAAYHTYQTAVADDSTYFDIWLAVLAALLCVWGLSGGDRYKALVGASAALYVTSSGV